MRPSIGILVLFASIGLPIAGFGAPQVGISWNTCSPLQKSQYFTGQRPYDAVVYVTNCSEPLVLWDLEIWVRSYLPSVHYCGGPSGDPPNPPDKCQFPDAWRFGDGGCQGSTRVTSQKTGVGCPLLNPGDDSISVAIPYLEQDSFLGTDRLAIRMAAYFGMDHVVQRDPLVRYTLLVLHFDHSQSVVGPASDGSCGNVQRGMTVEPGDYLVFASDINHIFNGQAAVDGDALWLGEGPVPATSTSWGRVRATYR